MREKIKLLSSANTGHSTPRPRTSGSIRTRWRSSLTQESTTHHLQRDEDQVMQSG
jgi:hypothetical protein